MRDRANQGEMFEEETWRKTFEVIPKMPFSFSYRFEDETGKASELQVLDWEAGALFWNCVQREQGDEAAALAKVRQKYFDDFTHKDLHFSLAPRRNFTSARRTPGTSSTSSPSRTNVSRSFSDEPRENADSLSWAWRETQPSPSRRARSIARSSPWEDRARAGPMPDARKALRRDPRPAGRSN